MRSKIVGTVERLHRTKPGRARQRRTIAQKRIDENEKIRNFCFATKTTKSSNQPDLKDADDCSVPFLSHRLSVGFPFPKCNCSIEWQNWLTHILRCTKSFSSFLIDCSPYPLCRGHVGVEAIKVSLPQLNSAALLTECTISVCAKPFTIAKDHRNHYQSNGISHKSPKMNFDNNKTHLRYVAL